MRIEWEDEELIVEPLDAARCVGDLVDGTMSHDELDGWTLRLRA